MKVWWTSCKSAGMPPGSVRTASTWPQSGRITPRGFGMCATGKMLTNEFEMVSGIRSNQFSPDGERVVIVASDKTARVWHRRTGKPLTEPLKHDGPITSAQFSRDGERIITASQDKTARIWDSRTGQPLMDPFKHDGQVNWASFSPDGRWAITASSDKRRGFGNCRLRRYLSRAGCRKWPKLSPVGDSMSNGLPNLSPGIHATALSQTFFPIHENSSRSRLDGREGRCKASRNSASPPPGSPTQDRREGHSP